MNTKANLAVLGTLLLASPVWASDFVGAAASEDISAFDRALSQQRKKLPAKSLDVKVEEAQLDQQVNRELRKAGDRVRSTDLKNGGREVAVGQGSVGANGRGGGAAQRSSGNKGGNAGGKHLGGSSGGKGHGAGSSSSGSSSKPKSHGKR